MVSPDQKIANAVGAKTARACDGCIRKRARWYCTADDAFLCQGCDASVHSANTLVRRHERVRLKTMASLNETLENSLPSWHKGFTRKARTPRNGKKGAFHRASKLEQSSVQNFNPLHLVPELGKDEAMLHEDNEEQLLYRVPVFDPFVTQLCMSGSSNEVATPVEAEAEVVELVRDNESRNMFDLNSLNGLSLPTDMELAEFAADVENLLGKGLDEESFDMEKLGFLDCTDQKDSINHEIVKVEEDEEENVICRVDFINNHEIDLMREPFELNFDYESPLWGDGHGDEVVHVKEDEDSYKHEEGGDGNKKRRILRLDYEGVMAAWDDQRSPWTSGHRPELDPGDCWPNCMGSCGIIQHHPYGGEMRMRMTMGSSPAVMDGGREARVSRYREKRRTRLFSKKIRYQVRKLNAEKRPRMKGRFVKRGNFAAAVPAGFPLLSK